MRMANISHDEMADIVARALLDRYRDLFGNVFIATISYDFPRPDFVYLPLIASPHKKRSIKLILDALNMKTLTDERLPFPTAFEFKTPFVSKHEYITGIGQAVTYNSIFPLSYLVIPETNVEGFDVINFVMDVVKRVKLSIGVVSYDPKNVSDVEIEKEAEPIVTDEKAITEAITSIKRSYAYWRETKPNEVFEALKISYELGKTDKINIMSDVLEILWDNILSKRFKSARRPASFRLNYRLFLTQTALLDKNGRLTPIGRQTLMLGETFGGDSKEFEDVVTYVLLRFGGHYTLLSKIYIEQSKMIKSELINWNSWSESLRQRLEQQNYYFSKDDFRIDYPRLPYAYRNYFSGIVSDPVFIEGKGLNINYPKIVEILDKGNRLFSPIERVIE
jgi:hypothetical protein